MSSIKKIAATLGVAAVSIGVVTAAPANAAQGGITNDLGLPGHAWFKISHEELMGKFNLNTQRACMSTGLSTWNCTPLGDAVGREFQAHPEAAGYWAEFYYPGPGGVQSGTW
jgi:hypothetical protein